MPHKTCGEKSCSICKHHPSDESEEPHDKDRPLANWLQLKSI